MSNCQIIGNGFYIVRTQAGFKKAVKHYWGKDEEFPEIDRHPGSYPMVVCLTTGYKGDMYVQVRGIHINDMLKGIKFSEDQHKSPEVKA